MLVTVVDDDQSIRESLPELVRECGYAVSVFPSAEAFLASDLVNETRCLLLDAFMPGMGGFDLLIELRERGNNTPIVFITGRRDEAIRAKLLAHGARACLFKPFSDAELLSALKAAMDEPVG
ncbi:response regulator transcription factor [Lysobacter sp. P5_B9]